MTWRAWTPRSRAGSSSSSSRLPPSRSASFAGSSPPTSASFASETIGCSPFSILVDGLSWWSEWTIDHVCTVARADALAGIPIPRANQVRSRDENQVCATVRERNFVAMRYPGTAQIRQSLPGVPRGSARERTPA